MFIKILIVYSTVVTTLLAAFTLAGSAAARGQDRVQQFDVIDVHRINVREPDGTLRMVISNHARLPGVIIRGKENPPVDRPYAGMLFYNDEGTENGGLVFGGHRNANGEVVDAGVALSFDRYGATSQFVQLAGVQDSKNPSLGSRCRRPSPQAIGGVSSSATTRKGSPACPLWTVTGERESCYRSHPTELPVFRFSTRTAKSSISSDQPGPNELAGP